MFQYIILGVVLVVLISLIYWIVWRSSDSKKRKSSEACLEQSAGVFDNNARRALDELARIAHPEADDYFRRGHIIQYNMLEGNVRTGRGERGRTRHERRTAVGHIVRDYTDALLGMRGRVTEIGGDRDIDPEFMIYHIEDFNRVLEDDEDAIIAQLVMGLNNAVTIHAPAVRREITEDRRDRAVATASTRAEAIALALDDATKFSNDRQNVHDSKVNNDLRETLRKLKLSAPHDIDPAACIDEAKDFINANYSNSQSNMQKINSARSTLDQIRKGDRVGTFNETEDYIFAYTWERCNHPRNRENAGLMREAIIDSLADSIENGTMVCINGRCGRVLNSLVTLDFDKEISENGAMTYEAYRNQIFQEIKIIVEREIERAKMSNDPEMRKVGEAFETGEESNLETEDKFKSILKDEIDRHIDNYAKKFTPDELDTIRQECYIYSTI